MRINKQQHRTYKVEIFAALYLTHCLAYAGDIKLKSSVKSTVYVYQTETENSPADDNAAIVVEPSVTGIYSSKKVGLALNAKQTLVEQKDEQQGANKNYTDIKLNSSFELLDDALRLSVNGSQDYQVTGISNSFFSDRVLSPGDLSKIQRYAAVLDFTIPNPKYIGLDVSTSYSDTSADQTINQNSSLNSNNTGVLTRIYNGNYVTGLFFDISAQYNNTERSNFNDFQSTTLNGTIRFDLYNNIKFVVRGSDENYDLDLDGGNGGLTNIDSSSYGAGFGWFNSDNRGIELTYNYLEEANNVSKYVGVDINWAFSARTSFDFNYGKRAYGDAYQLNFQYRLKSFRSTFSYNEDITTYARYGLVAESLGIFVCPIGSTELSECIQPESLEYVLQPGEEFRSFNGFSTDITNEVILTKAARYVIGYDKRKLKVSLNLGYRETEYLETNRLQKYQTAGLDFNYRLSRLTDFGLGINLMHREIEATDNNEDTMNVNFIINRKLSRHATVNSSLRYVTRTNDNGLDDVTDKRLTVGFNYQF